MSPPPAATAPPVSSLYPANPSQLFPLHNHNPPSCLTLTFFPTSFKRNSISGQTLRISVRPPNASISGQSIDAGENIVYDPELRSVLELATDSELHELERILFGPSYFSPLLKSITRSAEVDYFLIGEDPNVRDDFISMLEERFLFLAADARSTLRGQRPSYRTILLELRKKLNIACSAKLSSEDLEVEIFLHLFQEYSSEETGGFLSSNDGSKTFEVTNNLELGLSKWKVQKFAAIGIGATEMRSMILKGGGVLTLEKLLKSLAGRLSGKFLSEGAKNQIKKEIIKKSGQLAIMNLESGAALMTARQGLNAIAIRYLGLRSIAQLLGPVMWGTLLADVVIQMIGTDYARILRAIYALAQIRVYRSHKTASRIM